MGSLAQNDPVSTSEAEDGLDLLTAVLRSIELSPTLAKQRQSVESERGALLVESSTFDTTLSAELESEREVTPLSQSNRLVTGIDDEIVDAWVYGAEVTKTLRNGMSIDATVSSTYEDENVFLTPNRVQTGELDISLTQPLLQGFGRRVTTATEDAARLDLRAAEFTLRHAIEEQILSTVQAYWAYQAAALVLEVRKLSEAATQQLQEKTEVLIEADVVAQVEGQKLLAEVASKRVTRIGAMQDLEDARHQLGLAMGFDFEAIEALPLPITEIPGTDLDKLMHALELNSEPLDPSSVLSDVESSEPISAQGGLSSLPADGYQEVQAVAPDLSAVLARRHDRLSLLASREAAIRTMDAAVDTLLPTLDLTVEATWQWYAQASDLDSYDPFVGDPSEPGFAATLTLSLPVEQSSARGTILEAQASQRVTEIEIADLERTIRAQTRLAAREVGTRSAQLGSARAAAAAALMARQSEERKFELGLSTLLDVLNTEDNLVEAALQVISAGRDFADAVAELRFQSGLLRPASDGSLDLDRLTAVPEGGAP
ncbi:MAG: TolC family protein [Acidobacteriota bacterium]